MARDKGRTCSIIPITDNFAVDAEIVNKVMKNGLDLALIAVDFDAIPIYKIKSETVKEFGNKLDNNTFAMNLITTHVSEALSLIERMKSDIKYGFKSILDSIKSTKMENIILKINSFVQNFETEQERTISLSEEDLVNDLEQSHFLNYLRDSCTQAGDNLWQGMFDIIEQKYAIPADKNDKIAFSALDTLYYGSQTYMKVMQFLIEKYKFLAEYYYNKNNLDKFNEYFDLIKTTFRKFRYTFIGPKGFLDKIVSAYNEARSKDLGDIKQNLLGTQLNALQSMKDDIENMKLPFIMETPENHIRISFEKFIEVPIGAWEKGKEVGYALQNKENGTYSKVSEWITFKVKDKANPILRFPVDANHRERLIFRRIGDQPPQLIGALPPYKTDYRDISRDVFNAAESVHKDVAYNEAKVLLDNGGNVNVPFERERKAIHAASQGGNHRITKEFILTSNDTDINAKDENGYTPLHIASEAGRAPFVKMLINGGADLNVKTNIKLSTPLHLAAGKGFLRTVEALSNSDDINLNEKDREGFTPLHMAVVGGSKVVKSLISRNSTDANAQSETGLTPFHLAIMNQDENVAKVLVKSKKININIGNFKQYTALHFAAMKGYLNMVEFLLKQQDINVNIQTKDSKWTPLHLALFYKRKKAAKKLLNFDSIDVNLSAGGNVSPLHIAVAVGMLNIVQLLIKRGALLENTTDGGLTSLHIAAMRKNLKILNYLIDNKANITAKTNMGLTPLHLAAISGNIESVERLIRSGADMFENTNENLTLLHLSSSAGNLELMKYFIEKGLNIEAKTKEHMTPLQLTVLAGKLGVLRYIKMNKTNEKLAQNMKPLISTTNNIRAMKYLIKMGANSDIKTDQGLTLLHLACSVGNLATAKFLIENGADINVKSNQGFTPLHSAAAAGVLESVQFLLERGADAYAAENKGNMFFYYIVRSGNLNLVKYVIEDQMFDIYAIDPKRESIGVTDKSIVYWSVCDAVSFGKLEVVKYLVGTLKNDVCNPVYNAALIGNLDIVKYLVGEVGMYIDCSYDSEDQRLVPLFGAIENNNLDIVRYLLCKGVDVNKNYKNLTALLLAVKKDRLNMVDFLTKKGANYNIHNQHNGTLLHEAVLKNFDILKYLVSKNEININARDLDGNTVLHYAALYDIPDKVQKVKYLCSKGADITLKNKKNETPDDIDKSSSLELFGRCFEGFRMKRSENIARNVNEHNFIINRPSDSYHSNFQKLESMEHSKSVNYWNEYPNINGTLLILDLFLKWITNKKYNSFMPESTREFEVQADALTITEKFEKLLKYYGGFSLDIDFSKVHSDVFKALKYGNKDDIPKILYSHVTSVSSMKPEKINELLSKIK